MLEVNVNGSGAAHGAADLIAEAAGDSAGPGIESLAVSNLAFAEDLYFQFLRDPASVDPGWRRVFERLDGPGAGAEQNGANRAALEPPAAFRRSIFGAAAVAAPSAIQSRTSVRLLSERVQRLVAAYQIGRA